MLAFGFITAVVALMLGASVLCMKFAKWIVGGDQWSVADQVVLACAADVMCFFGLGALAAWAIITAVLFPFAWLVFRRPHWFTIWSVVKAVFAVAISPVILLAFFLDKSAFIDLMSALWPHLDIFTPEGKLYLRRWFMTPKTQLYHPRFLHLILLPDEGRDPHDHPGAFTTTILMNGYDEEVYFPRQDRAMEIRVARVGTTLHNPEGHTHIVKLIGPTLSWVKGWKRGKKWGFWKLDPFNPEFDEWVESEEYGEKGDERKSWTLTGR